MALYAGDWDSRRLPREQQLYPWPLQVAKCPRNPQHAMAMALAVSWQRLSAAVAFRSGAIANPRGYCWPGVPAAALASLFVASLAAAQGLGCCFLALMLSVGLLLLVVC